MKTNIVLNSKSRELFGVLVRTETKTEFMNISDLQSAYNNGRILHGWSEKRVDHILPQVENRERLYYILFDTKIINVDFLTFMKNCTEKGFYKYLKELKVYRTSGRREEKTTWANPYIWGLIAMELNPMIYSRVVIWFTDNLIINRMDAGDMYKDLSRAISKWSDVDYISLARGMNHVVFGRHESGIRNTGTEEQLKELHVLESNLAFSIDSGFLKTFPEVMEHVRNIWRKKNSNTLAI